MTTLHEIITTLRRAKVGTRRTKIGHAITVDGRQAEFVDGIGYGYVHASTQVSAGSYTGTVTYMGPDGEWLDIQGAVCKTRAEAARKAVFAYALHLAGQVGTAYRMDAERERELEAGEAEAEALADEHMIVMAEESEAPSAPERAPLTVADVNALAAIVGAAGKGSRVARAYTDQPSAVIYGTARSIGDVNGNHMGARDDVRDAYLRVTTEQGWEVFWPISELITALRAGEFSPDYPR